MYNVMTVAIHTEGLILTSVRVHLICACVRVCVCVRACMHVCVVCVPVHMHALTTGGKTGSEVSLTTYGLSDSKER